MRQTFRVAAVGCCLPLVQAGGAFPWSRDQARNAREYAPAYETRIEGNMQTVAMGPAPTSPPQPVGGRGALLGGRQDGGSVCGYLQGSSAYPYACAVEDECVFSTLSGTWVAGCCGSTSLNCPLATTCIDSSVWATVPEASIGVHTYSCTSSDYPYCLTMTYDDLVGYSVMNCAATSYSSAAAILREPNTATSPEDLSFTADGSAAVASPSSSPKSSAASPNATPAAAKSSIPMGPVIGGAVGGIAVIALLILGLVLLLRKRGARNHHPPPATHDALPPPPMEQQWQQSPPPPPPAADHHHHQRISAMTAPPYDAKTAQATATHSVYDPALAASPPGSPPPPPPPQPQQQYGPTPTSLPPQSSASPPPPPPPAGGVSPTEAAFQGGGAGPTQGAFQPYQQQPDGASYYEMPVARADGQLREMP